MSTNDNVKMENQAATKKPAQGADYIYVHKFQKPFVYGEKTYEQLIFDWGSLTGRDGLAIENELQALGKPVIIPTVSGEYLLRMAVRACDKPIAADAFDLMSLFDYNKIRSSARSFLLKSEL